MIVNSRDKMWIASVAASVRARGLIPRASLGNRRRKYSINLTKFVFTEILKFLGIASVQLLPADNRTHFSLSPHLRPSNPAKKFATRRHRLGVTSFTILGTLALNYSSTDAPRSRENAIYNAIESKRRNMTG